MYVKIYFTFPWLRVNALYYFVCNSRGGGSIICLNFMTHGHILCLLCMVNKSSTSLLLLFVKYLVWSNPYIDFIIIRLVPRMKLICIFHHFTWITVKTVDNPLKIAKLYDTRLVFYWLQLDSKCYKQKNVITLLLNLQFFPIKCLDCTERNDKKIIFPLDYLYIYNLEDKWPPYNHVCFL